MVADMRAIARKAKQAGRSLATLGSAEKSAVLRRMALALRAKSEDLKAQNAADLEKARADGLPAAMLDRLTLSDKVIQGMAQALEEIADLPDPVGTITNMVRRPNGLMVGRMRIPLGVVAMIYESRPNVTADAVGLCLKSGNAVILRGGSEAFHSNQAIVAVLKATLTESGMDPDIIGFIPVTDRAAIMEMLKLEDDIDLVIPRGGEGLIRTVVENSRIPVLKHYKGVCHLYVDASAALGMAVKVVVNSKVQRPGVCNASRTRLAKPKGIPA